MSNFFGDVPRTRTTDFISFLCNHLPKYTPTASLLWQIIPEMCFPCLLLLPPTQTQTPTLSRTPSRNNNINIPSDFSDVRHIIHSYIYMTPTVWRHSIFKMEMCCLSYIMRSHLRRLSWPIHGWTILHSFLNAQKSFWFCSKMFGFV